MSLRDRLSEIYTRWAKPAERRRSASPLVDELVGLLAEFQPPSSGPEPDLPEGVRKLEGCTVCLTDKGTIVVLGDPHDLGDPEADEHPHSCDQMGCGSIGPHVLARGPVTGDAWADSCVRTLMSLLDELLNRLGTDYRAPAGWEAGDHPYPHGDEEEGYELTPDQRGSWEHEATALVQAVLCQTADWSHVEARLAELQTWQRAEDHHAVSGWSDRAE